MTDKNIKCPSCSYEFELSDVLSKQIRDAMKLELQTELNKEKKQLLERESKIKALEEDLKSKEGDIEKQIEERVKAQEITNRKNQTDIMNTQ